jgi:hypothetical protein
MYRPLTRQGVQIYCWVAAAILYVLAVYVSRGYAEFFGVTALMVFAGLAPRPAPVRRDTGAGPAVPHSGR